MVVLSCPSKNTPQWKYLTEELNLSEVAAYRIYLKYQEANGDFPEIETLRSAMQNEKSSINNDASTNIYESLITIMDKILIEKYPDPKTIISKKELLDAFNTAIKSFPATKLSIGNNQLSFAVRAFKALMLKEDISIPSLIKTFTKNTDDTEASEDNASEKELNAKESEAGDTDSDKRIGKIQKRYKPYLDALRRNEIPEPEYEMIYFTNAAKQWRKKNPGYTKEQFIKFLDDYSMGSTTAALVVRTFYNGITLDDSKYRELISLINEYGSFKLRNVSIIIRSLFGKKESWRTQSISKQDVYATQEFRLKNTLQTFSYNNIADSDKALKAAWDEFIARYDAIPSKDENGNVISENVKEKHDLANEFLYQITGLRWDEYYNSENEEFYELKDNKYVKSKFTAKEFRDKLPSLYRFSKGTYYPALSSDLVFYVLQKGVSTKRNDKFQTGSPSKNLISYFTTIPKGGGTYNPIRKLSSHSESRNTLSGNFNEKRRVFIELDSHFETIFNNLEERFKSGANKLAKYFMSLNETERDNSITRIEGIRGYREINGQRQMAEIDAIDMNEEEILTLLLVDYYKGKDKYNQWVGIFGDKKKFYTINVPKIENQMSVQEMYEALKKEGLSDSDIMEFTTLFKKILNDKLRHDGELDALSSKSIEEQKRFAYDFLYSYTINMREMNELIHGNIDVYMGKGKSKQFIELIKRASNVLSTGVAPDPYIKGGLGETFNHVIVDDPLFFDIPGFTTDKMTDGLQLGSDDAMDRLQVSYGSVITRENEFEKLNSLKMNYSGLDENNERHLNKCNTIRASSVDDPVYQELAKWMKKHKVDFITFKSGAKVTPSNSKHTQLFNSKNDFIKGATPNLITLRTENLRYQQDLRHSTDPHTERQPVQLLYNFLRYIDDQKSMINKFNNLTQEKFQKKLKRQFKKDEYEQLNEIFEESDFIAVIEYLKTRGTVKNPRYRKAIERKIANYSTKNGFERKTNRVALQVIPAMGNKLRKAEVIDNEGIKVVRLAQCNCNIEGVRYAEEKLGWDKKTAIKYIEDNRDQYPDMFYIGSDGAKYMRDWEIEEIRGGVIIPGEIICLTRIPADHPHSTTMARANKRLRGADNYVQVDHESYIMSGEDFDGDKRYAEVLFKKDKNILMTTKNFQGRANLNLMSYASIFYSVRNFEQLREGINKKYFNKLLKELETLSAPIEKSNFIMHMLNAFNSNKAGRQTIGITANLSRVFDLCSKYKIGTNQFDIKVNNNTISINGITSDKYGLVKNLIGGLLNLSTDNGNEQIIDKLGYNEITAKPAVFMIASDSTMDTTSKNRSEYEQALEERAFNTVRYLLFPEVKEFVQMKREQRSSSSRYENDNILFDKLISKYGNDVISKFKDVWNAANEFSQIMNIIDITESVPKDIYAYNNAKTSFMKFMNSIRNEPFINVPQFWSLNLKNFRTKEGYLVEELQGILRNMEFNKDFLFKDSLQNTPMAKDIIDAFKYSLLGTVIDDSGATKTLNDNLVRKIGSFMDKYLMLSSIGETRNYTELLEYLGNILDDKKFIENNKFINAIQVVNENGIKRIQIQEAKKSGLSDTELKEIWKDFDLLPEQWKKAFYSYQVMKYGLSETLFFGSFLPLISPTYNSEISEKINNEFDRWKKGFNNPLQKDLYVGLIDFYDNIFGRSESEFKRNYPLDNIESLINKAINNSNDFYNKQTSDYQSLVYAVEYTMRKNKIEMHPFDFINKYQKQLLGKVEYITDYKDIKLYNATRPGNAKMTSGGAIGSDRVFADIAKEYGVTNIFNYYHPGMAEKLDAKYVNAEISEADIEEGQAMMKKAAMLLSETKDQYSPSLTTVPGQLITRNWAQVKYSDAIYAVSERFIDIPEDIKKINETNQRRVVAGGTGWAVQFAIMTNKPLFVFDQETKQWYAYDKEISDFVPYKDANNGTIPKLTNNFAGIGTREINEDGKKAIKDLFMNTFPKKDEVYKFGQKIDENKWMMAGDMSVPFKSERGATIPSVLHYFWASHVKDDIPLIQSILKAENANKVIDIKNLNAIPNFSPGEEIRIMKKGMKMKLDQNPELVKSLLATGDKYLVLASTDLFWGRSEGMAGGENRLGEIMMQLREEYRNEPKKTTEEIPVENDNVVKYSLNNVQYDLITNEVGEAIGIANITEMKQEAINEVLKSYNDSKKSVKKTPTFDTQVTQEDIDMFYDLAQPMDYDENTPIPGTTKKREINEKFKGKSTMDLILSGDRTGTTRPYTANVQKIKKGMKIKFFKQSTGQEAIVRVTSDLYKVSEVTPEVWSQREGLWAPSEYYRAKNANMYQYTFELISGNKGDGKFIKSSSLTTKVGDKDIKDDYKHCKGFGA